MVEIWNSRIARLRLFGSTPGVVFVFPKWYSGFATFSDRSQTLIRDFVISIFPKNKTSFSMFGTVLNLENEVLFFGNMEIRKS